MRSATLLVRLLTASAVLAAGSAQAGIISVSGAALQIGSPASVVPNAGYENFTRAAVFAERQDVVLTQAAQLNATTPGLFDSLADLTPGALAIGTLVSSYYLHADPVGASGTVYTYIGSVTFDSDILGIAALNAELLGTNLLGAPGTTYPGAATVNGLDYADGTDWFSISGDRRTLSFRLAAWAGADALRVVTEGNAVPEPGALGLASLALGAMVLARRRREA